MPAPRSLFFALPVPLPPCTALAAAAAAATAAAAAAIAVLAALAASAAARAALSSTRALAVGGAADQLVQALLPLGLHRLAARRGARMRSHELVLLDVRGVRLWVAEKT